MRSPSPLSRLVLTIALFATQVDPLAALCETDEVFVYESVSGIGSPDVEVMRVRGLDRDGGRHTRHFTIVVKTKCDPAVLILYLHATAVVAVFS